MTTWNSRTSPTTTYTDRVIPTTTYNTRDPIGLVYLTDLLGNILTDDSSALIYGYQLNTVYSVRTPI